MNIVSNVNNHKNDYLLFFLVIFLSILPISLLAGSAVININLVVISVIYITLVLKKKIPNLLNEKYFILLSFFWLSLIVNLIFSINFENSLSRTFGFIRFLILTLSIKFCLEARNGFYKKILFKSWCFILAIVIIDLIFEYFKGFNTLGFKSYMPGRLSGFLDQELVIGHYFSAICLLIAIFIWENFKSQKVLIFTLILFLIISLLIGERSNFLRLLSMVFIFLFIVNKNPLHKKIFLTISFFVVISFIVNSNIKLKNRFYHQFFEPIIKLDFNYLTKNNLYLSIYNQGYNVFKNNKYFGVGLKNFRIESQKDEYMNKDNPFGRNFSTTHPHQVHLEFLSETGFFGYFSFIIFMIVSIYFFFKSYFTNRNYLSLAGMLFVLMSIMPLIPSGSFFTTFGATLFWINYGIMISKENKKEALQN